MTSTPKCKAKGGSAACKDPKCPERVFFLNQLANAPKAHSAASLTPYKSSLPITPGAWTERDTVLFKTIHGSRLYNLHHVDSDEDFYVVTPTRRTARDMNAKQTIQGEIDTMTVDFASFVRMADKGVPQALETMFSRKSKSDFFEEYRNSYYASSPEVIHTYMRTIKSFAFSDKFKLKRHALRLSANLKELLYEGRFNPSLNDSTVERITRQASQSDEEFFKSLKKESPIEIDWDIKDKTF